MRVEEAARPACGERTSHLHPFAYCEWSAGPTLRGWCSLPALTNCHSSSFALEGALDQ